MTAFRAFVRRIVMLADHAIGWLLLLTVAVNVAAVWQRYVMLDSIPWSEEAIRYLGVWITFLGAASASWYGEHMDMNMLDEFGGPRFQSWHQAGLQVLVMIFAAIVLWQGARYCWLNGAQTAPTSGLPMLYVYGAIAIGGFLQLLVSAVKIHDAFVPAAVTETGRKVVL